MELPPIVDQAAWQQASDDFEEREKAAVRARDEIAAERRRQPLMEMPDDFEFEGPDGTVRLVDLFEGRSQLLLYHFWFPAPDTEQASADPGASHNIAGHPCTGCSMVIDQIGHLAHLHARDTTFAAVSRAPQELIQAYKERMGWDIPWYTDGEDFQIARKTTELFSLDSYLRLGGRVLLQHELRRRRIDNIGSVWTLLDLTPLGRQEEWEDSPPGYPQGPTYDWWRKHDEYGAGAPARPS